MTADYIWRMEDVLDRYAEAPDPARPVICLDECPYAMRADVRPPLPLTPGRPRREDCEFARRGACALAVAVARHRGGRHVWTGERRTAADFAGWLKELTEVHDPDAETIRLVVDNLNTHTPAALDATFPPAEAHRIARTLEFPYTPKHGRWLTMVETELRVLARQWLARRLPTMSDVAREVAAWAAARNAAHATIAWRFTTDRARTTLGRHYPA